MKDISSFYLKKSEKLKKVKKFEESLKFTDKAVQIKGEEKSDDFWYKRAVNLRDIGEYEDAIECLDKDLSIHKKSCESYFLKGLVLMQTEDYAEAIECFNKCSEERGQSYLSNSKKVERLKNAKKFEKALIYTDLSVNAKTLDDEFWHYKGIAFFKLKKYEDAIECFTNGLKMKKLDIKILYDQAKCELFMGNEEKCLDILEKSCDLDPNIKEKLKVDIDFSQLSKNRRFRDIVGF